MTYRQQVRDIACCVGNTNIFSSLLEWRCSGVSREVMLLQKTTMRLFPGLHNKTRLPGTTNPTFDTYIS